jgi:hypothetical protein
VNFEINSVLPSLLLVFVEKVLSCLFTPPLGNFQQAYEQYLELNEAWGQITVTNAKDTWKLIRGSEIFSTKKTYRHLMGQYQVHQISRLLWKNKCQPKHKVFYWLWLKKQAQHKEHAKEEKHDS